PLPGRAPRPSFPTRRSSDLSAAPTARAAVPTAPPDASPLGLIPPRLSYLDGDVSFWRPGAQDWSPAGVNIPLAPGDELYTAHQGDRKSTRLNSSHLVISYAV